MLSPHFVAFNFILILHGDIDARAIKT